MPRHETGIEVAGLKGPQLLENKRKVWVKQNLATHTSHKMPSVCLLWAALPLSTHHSILTSVIFQDSCANAIFFSPHVPSLPNTSEWHRRSLLWVFIAPSCVLLIRSFMCYSVDFRGSILGKGYNIRNKIIENEKTNHKKLQMLKSWQMPQTSLTLKKLLIGLISESNDKPLRLYNFCFIFLDHFFPMTMIL